MILKTPEEINVMREAGKINSAVRQLILEAAEPGVTTWELDQLAESEIEERGGYPSFKGFEGFPFAVCINLNDGVVHGYPSKDVVLDQGDLFTVDLGVLYKGFHSDAAETILVGRRERGRKGRFLQTGRAALKKAISNCQVGNFLGDISYAIQETIEGRGYSVVKSLVGHGIGVDLHESPQIPGYGKPGRGPKLKDGAVLAIEVIYNQGGEEVYIGGDGWTVRTADGSNSAIFEHTVAITKDGPRVLTL